MARDLEGSSRSLAVEAAGRAARRAGAVVDMKMKRGLSSLASIAATAFWFGVLVSVLGSFNLSRGLGGERTSVMLVMLGRLGEELVPVVLGLTVALSAAFMHKYLLGVAGTLNLEMQSTTLQIMNDLSALESMPLPSLSPAEPKRLSPGLSVEASYRASQRAAAQVRLDMAKGMTSLASVTVTAPLLGMLGTIFGILSSFRGVGTYAGTMLSAFSEEYSAALIPVALGLGVALMAWFVRAKLSTDIEAMDLEMKSASVGLVNSLRAIHIGSA